MSYIETNLISRGMTSPDIKLLDSYEFHKNDCNIDNNM